MVSEWFESFITCKKKNWGEGDSTKSTNLISELIQKIQLTEMQKPTEKVTKMSKWLDKNYRKGY